MAKNNCTPVPYWLSMPLVEFVRWLNANNSVVDDIQKKIEAH